VVIAHWDEVPLRAHRNEVCYYPRSRKIYWAGVGLIGRIEHIDYWVDED
jgi:hypothetical protein